MNTPVYLSELLELSGFNPNQPRDPKGSPTGGQFASAGANIDDDLVSIPLYGSGEEKVFKIPEPRLEQAIAARDAARGKMNASALGSKKWRDAEDDYNFWSNKVAMLDAMQKAGIK